LPVILTQTDTTVGFLSQDAQKLFEIKSRPQTKPFLKVYNSLQDFKKDFKRIPYSHKKTFRRAKKTTFVVKNQAVRIAPVTLNSYYLREFKWHYSTSANESSKEFERSFCEEKSDIIIESSKGLYETDSSKIYKINKSKKRRLR
jgi:tRNA A37 threonylcarbamoyladenosine synthetase subunit TsaC/SUA5/YrdC